MPILSERALTNVPGLDELLNGGFPRGRVILILGGPGTGKTVLSTQFLVAGVKNYNENGMMVSLDESKVYFYKEMAKFGWDLEKMEKEKKFLYLDASPIRNVPEETKIGTLVLGKSEFSMASLIKIIKTYSEVISAKRIVIDPLSSLVVQFPDIVQRRSAFIDLAEALVRIGATTLITSELDFAGEERSFSFEEYLAHGVIVLRTAMAGKSSVRILQVEKMRESQVDNQPRPYKITGKGLEVYSKEIIF